MSAAMGTAMSTATTEPSASPLMTSRRERALRDLTAEQRGSRISDGHRLIRAVRARPFQLYSARRHATRAVTVDAEEWLAAVMPALRAAVSRTASARLDTALARARKRMNEYGVRRVGSAEAVAEALSDGRWFRTQRAHMGRAELRDRVARALRHGEPVELVFPVFSRKPFSPVKNRGVAPDTAELHSLARCAALAHTVAALSPTGCRFTVLADGRKYNRACGTPGPVVAAYQDTLRRWVSDLGADGVLRVVDYEEWVARGLGAADLRTREEYYQRRAAALADRYGRLFSPHAPRESLERLAGTADAHDPHDAHSPHDVPGPRGTPAPHSAADPHGAHDPAGIGGQLAHTFWSIATSVHYTALGTGHRDLPDGPCYSDAYQEAYTLYVAHLGRPLTGPGTDGPLPAAPYGRTAADPDLHLALREEAWAAACRYVAISLTDRELNLVRETAPRAVKLTIHGKPGELHFTTAASRDANMTAQHSTGGYALRDGRVRPTFRYRIEREAAGETPVLLHGAAGRGGDEPHHLPSARLERMQQPIAYVDDPAPLLDGTFPRLLEDLEI
ncbi:L-tyrosine/L-tryptophan isonitrile synthase family protein [Streptomyces fradiae]|uniref:L-tyrosine/L-tryptophan isonitrile synthase family protein n=1 Tax=Streptomyces fradiae TaxID=1906 RepID=UPI0029429C5A|nr:L-tyrosine/L-tryptophan isonitrile synthase family protein [Streptomyces fradiae]WOI59544.1 L-tyrosine/L-tryptophan isonitrile synthase family protein [Streptomyces fradiae]